MGITNILNAWWLRGHLIVLIIIGLIGINHLPTQSEVKKEITYEKLIPTITVPGGYGGKFVPFKSTPTPLPTKTPKAVPTRSSVLRVGRMPACFYVVTQYYGQNGEQGDDFGCGYHTLIPALWGGILVAAERTCWNVNCSSTSGGIIAINALVPGLGLETTYYLHIDSVYPGLHIGSKINKGQIIAESGGQTYGGNWPADSQFSQGPHLEIGFSAWFICQPDYHILCKGRNTNPLYYIERARDD